MSITINLISTPDAVARRQKADIEGPTRAQAVKLAARRRELVDQARAAEAAGDDDMAFERDCEAWDVESDLRAYGFDIETGRPVRR